MFVMILYICIDTVNLSQKASAKNSKPLFFPITAFHGFRHPDSGQGSSCFFYTEHTHTYAYTHIQTHDERIQYYHASSSVPHIALRHSHKARGVRSRTHTHAHRRTHPYKTCAEDFQICIYVIIIIKCFCRVCMCVTNAPRQGR